MKNNCIKSVFCKPFVALAVFLAVAITCNPVFSNPVPGTTYDQTNYQELEGVALTSLYNWLKDGKVTVKFGELESAEWKKSSQYLAASEKNKDRYDFNENGGLVNKADGKLVQEIYGYPFPEIDLNDPKAGQKLVENTGATIASMRGLKLTSALKNFTATGLKSSWVAQTSNIYYRQNPQGSIKNKKGYKTQNYTLLTDPFEVKGTCNIIHSYIEDKEDTSYAYVPQLRRIIRTSSANKSEGAAGSLLAPDDLTVWGGKNTSMTWRYIETKNILVPFSYTDLRKVKENEDGSHVVEPYPLEFGIDKEGFTGAPWAPVNVTWVVRKAHAIEMLPKDPKYNYGKSILYVDAENYSALAKEAFDRGMKPFKIVYSYSGIRIGDKTGADHIGFSDGFIVMDTQKDTASCSYQISQDGKPNLIYLPAEKIGPKDFTVQAMVRRSK